MSLVIQSLRLWASNAGAWVRSLVRKIRETNQREGRDGGSITSKACSLIELENPFPQKYVTSFYLQNKPVYICQGPEAPMTHRGLSPAFSFPGWEGRVFSSPEAHVSVRRSEVPGCGEAEVLTLFTFLLCDGHLTLLGKSWFKKKRKENWW